MDKETIKQYQKIYKFKDKDITWANTANNDFLKLPKKEKTYFFVQSDGAIYIGTVLKKTGVNAYKTRIEKNINNILEVAEGNETQILINNIKPEQNMLLWAEIPNYDSVDNLLENLSMMNVNKKQKINEFLFKEAQEDNNPTLNNLQSTNSNRKYQFNTIKSTPITNTGARFGGKGRKKTKRNKNKNKKRKTHRKR